MLIQEEGIHQITWLLPGSSPSCLDDRGLLRWIKIFRTPGESSPDFKKSGIFEIDVPYPNFMFRFHVRSTRVPSEKEKHDKLEKTTLKSLKRFPQRNVACSIEKWSLIFGLISQRIDKMHARRKSEGIICGRASIQWPTSTCCSCRKSKHSLEKLCRPKTT